jgi:hypothetical protein
VSLSRILPTIWVHMCSVSYVSFHSASSSSGHVFAAVAVIGFLLSLSEVPDNAMEGSDFLYDVFDY